MSKTVLVVSPDGKTTIPVAESRIVEVDSEQYAVDPTNALSESERILTLPPDEDIAALAAAFRSPPAGTADPQELALARMLADTAFGIGGLADCYRLVPALHDGDVVVVFAEGTSEGLSPIAELWPPRDGYTPPPGDGDGEQLLARAQLPALEAAIFPRFPDGRTGDLIASIDAATPPALLLALLSALERVSDGIYDGDEENSENRASGVEVTLTPAS